MIGLTQAKFDFYRTTTALRFDTGTHGFLLEGADRKIFEKDEKLGSPRELPKDGLTERTIVSVVC